MAICNSCNSESPRVRSRWDPKGVQLPDECPQCAPGSFEKFSNPSDQKIWMGFEAHPNEYVQSADGGFDRKLEYRAEQEELLSQETSDERETRLEAERVKRATRRTLPMDEVETTHALAKARDLALALEQSALHAHRNADEQAVQSWIDQNIPHA